jgi:hypothetical protein
VKLADQEDSQGRREAISRHSHERRITASLGLGPFHSAHEGLQAVFAWVRVQVATRCVSGVNSANMSMKNLSAMVLVLTSLLGSPE